MMRWTPPSPQPSEHHELEIASLDAGARAAVDALVNAYAGVDLLSVGTATLMEIPLDLVATRFTHTRPLAAQGAGLARQLVHYAMRSVRAPSAAELRTATEALDEAATRFLTRLAEAAEIPADPAASALTGPLRDATLTELNELVREVGLEELDVDLQFAFDSDGEMVLAAVPVPAETAHVWLLSRLYPRLELAVSADPLLALERRASRWWLERWSSPLRRSEEWRFTWHVREQEYSLVERETVSLDEPITSAFRRQEFFGEVPARQQHMARALSESFAGVFVVRESEGSRLVLEDARDGRHLVVHEHNPGITYQPGFAGIGRLLPIAEDRYLRSPGMAFLQLPTPGTLSTLTQGLTKAEESVGAAVGIETLLALLVSRTQVPRRVLAADSPDEAKRLLDSFREAMAQRGLLETVPGEEAPEELVEQARAAGGDQDLEYLRMPVDEPLSAWVGALAEQARPAERKTRRAKEKKGKQKKQQGKGRKKR